MLLKIFIDDKLDLCLFLIVSVFNTMTSVPLPVPLRADLLAVRRSLLIRIYAYTWYTYGENTLQAWATARLIFI